MGLSTAALAGTSKKVEGLLMSGAYLPQLILCVAVSLVVLGVGPGPAILMSAMADAIPIAIGVVGGEVGWRSQCGLPRGVRLTDRGCLLGCCRRRLRRVGAARPRTHEGGSTR